MSFIQMGMRASEDLFINVAGYASVAHCLLD